MRRSVVHWTLKLIAISALATLTIPAAGSQPLTIQGSSTLLSNLLAPNQRLIETLSGQSLKIVSVRSDVGLLRLLASQAEFAAISTSLASEVKLLRPANPGLPYDKLMAFPIAKVRVAFAVNPSNPVRKASVEQVQQVLAGDVTNWKQLGGRDDAIRVAFARAGDGVTLSVQAELLDGQALKPANAIRVVLGAQVVKVVEQEPRALGVAQLGLVRESRLPELTIDRVIDQELSIVTLDAPNAAEQAVISALRQVAAKAGPPIH